jgi:hypothetical protein
MKRLLRLPKWQTTIPQLVRPSMRVKVRQMGTMEAVRHIETRGEVSSKAVAVAVVDAEGTKVEAIERDLDRNPTIEEGVTRREIWGVENISMFHSKTPDLPN